METKECPNPECDAKIGEAEINCPKCGIVVAELEEQIASVERAHKAIVKKRKAEKAKRDAERPPELTPQPKKSFLRNLIPGKK